VPRYVRVPAVTSLFRNSFLGALRQKSFKGLLEFKIVVENRLDSRSSSWINTARSGTLNGFQKALVEACHYRNTKCVSLVLGRERFAPPEYKEIHARVGLAYVPSRGCRSFGSLKMDSCCPLKGNHATPSTEVELFQREERTNQVWRRRARQPDFQCATRPHSITYATGCSRRRLAGSTYPQGAGALKPGCTAARPVEEICHSAVSRRAARNEPALR